MAIIATLLSHWLQTKNVEWKSSRKEIITHNKTQGKITKHLCTKASISIHGAIGISFFPRKKSKTALDAILSNRTSRKPERRAPPTSSAIVSLLGKTTERSPKEVLGGKNNTRKYVKLNFKSRIFITNKALCYDIWNGRKKMRK